MSGVLANNVTTYTSMICSHEEGVLTIDQQFKHTSPQKLWERMMMVKENKGGSSSCLHMILSVECTNGHKIHDTLVYTHEDPPRIDACCNFHENVMDLEQNTVVH